MRKTVRHVTINEDPKVAAKQNGENARDLNEALQRKVDGYYASVTGYAAAGSGSKISLQPGPVRPMAVLLVRACSTTDRGGDLGAVTRCNFYHDANGLGVFEPSGLTSNVQYDLTFLVLE
jgi:hypothetical protein